MNYFVISHSGCDVVSVVFATAVVLVSVAVANAVVAGVDEADEDQEVGWTGQLGCMYICISDRAGYRGDQADSELVLLYLPRMLYGFHQISYRSFFHTFSQL